MGRRCHRAAGEASPRWGDPRQRPNHEPSAVPQAEPSYRYAAILAGTLVEVLFLIVVPASNWSRAGGLAIATAILLFVIVTARAGEQVRRFRATGISVLAVIVIALEASGSLPFWMLAIATGLVTAAIPAALVRGLLRMVQQQGVTG